MNRDDFVILIGDTDAELALIPMPGFYQNQNLVIGGTLQIHKVT